MTSRRLLALCLALTGLLLLIPAGAGAATKKTPKITKVSPMRIGVGGTITIRGTNFSSKRTRNTVFFRAPGGRTALAKPVRASRTKLVVKVPAGVARILSTKPTRFRLRVLAGNFSSYTAPRLSPVIVPITGPGGGSGGGGSGGGSSGDSFTPSQPAAPVCPSSDGGLDDDNDLLSNSLETQLHTDPCNVDSDGDTVQDGFEYKSAVDLNDDEFQEPNESHPHPGASPYPNPLNQDGNVDYDGDSLTLAEEQELWKYTIAQGAGRTLAPLTYSDGEQYSVQSRRPDGRRVPSLDAVGYQKQVDFLTWASANGYRQVRLEDGAPWYDHDARNAYDLLDFNRSGPGGGGEEATAPPGYWFTESTYYDYDQDQLLADDERDEDGDGLTNFDEQHGRLQPAYWTACYPFETAYPVQYGSTSYVDSDTDGDGVLDGADDQDHDDIPNLMEMSRNAASGLDDTNGRSCTPRVGLPTDFQHQAAYGRVNPFNPCLPASWSRTCIAHPGFGSSPAPFDGSPNWYALN